jgi:ABC-type antimicrobial peptide transport system permease subunit
MKRWALHRYTVAGAWLRDRTDRLAADAADRGQTSLEYLGIAVVIVVIIGVLAGTTSIGSAILSAILDKITAITNAG